ncbi:MAG: WxcM-like domain-containing protein [Candidatus Scalindua sp. AMX11]|nr:MAG: WxcM-like domain-containing protein [Candidatus Scalindua sp.]NOG84106.1 FdtA/QdtA family cupin domain-containing protein [Planctomycetota bacterium]RZV99006.1 MAG: WxcM-like domain-containing protein [Candidatus Scalindua sp. SCAELEC01]TDE66979.1 MAG: WxcM-like domain-containing protein [Candidatus Scalindua sp. AMX11]
MKRIKVKNSGIIKLQFVDDFPDGILVIGEAKRNIPFEPKRLYYITNLSNPKATRGKHAHKQLEQYIFCVSGTFRLHLDDGTTKQNIILDSPYYGIRLGPMLWHTMSKFSRDCVILVVASDYFDEEDYIRDYKQFLEYTNT